MTNDLKKALADYFDAWDLVDLLEITTEDIIDAFDDMIEDRIDEIKEHIGYVEDDDDDATDGE